MTGFPVIGLMRLPRFLVPAGGEKEKKKTIFDAATIMLTYTGVNFGSLSFNRKD